MSGGSHVHHVAALPAVEQVLAPSVCRDEAVAVDQLGALHPALRAGDADTRSGEVSRVVEREPVDGVAFGHGETDVAGAGPVRPHLPGQLR